MANVLEFDEMKMYFGEDYKVNDYITIHPPSVGEIIEFGERKYFSVIHSLTCIPSDMKSQLFDMGIDYEEISDYELFIMLSRTLKKEDTSIIFGDLDLSKFEIAKNSNDQLILYDYENSFKIDELAYAKISGYLRKYHGIKPKIEKAANKTTKKLLIQLDREDIAKAQKQGYKSQMKSLVSAMMRYPGFKYKSNELKECSYYEFMDTVYGAQIYISSTALLKGSYSGMIDTSKINKKEFNWMRCMDDENDKNIISENNKITKEK